MCSFAGLFSSLSYFFAQNGRNSCDYQLALQRSVKKEGSKLVYPLDTIVVPFMSFS